MITPEQLAKSGTEHGHQTALFCWAAMNLETYPELKWMHAIPNGGYRNKTEAGRLKAEGVKAGVSDVFLPVESGCYHGLYLEMKKPGEKASAKQLEFGAFVKTQKYAFHVCDHWQKARDILIKYFENPDLTLDKGI